MCNESLSGFFKKETARSKETFLFRDFSGKQENGTDDI
jgi:hypothetical protein